MKIALSITYLLLSILIQSGLAHAVTLTETGAEITVEYKEPTANANGTPLTDLKHTVIYTEIRADGLPETKHPPIPATGLTGGGAISKSIIIPSTAGTEIIVDVQVTATDIHGNESKRSPIQSITIDRLPPNPPD